MPKVLKKQPATKKPPLLDLFHDFTAAVESVMEAKQTDKTLFDLFLTNRLLRDNFNTSYRPLPRIYVQASDLRKAVDACKKTEDRAEIGYNLELLGASLYGFLLAHHSALQTAKRHLAMGYPIINDTKSWQQIEALKWGERLDYDAIQKELHESPKLLKRLDDFSADAFSVIDEVLDERNLFHQSDDVRRDVINHVIGLGRAEFIKTLKNPTVVLAGHAKGGRGKKEGYEESFSYCFHPLEDPAVEMVPWEPGTLAGTTNK
jgi:hypothetical protein